MKKTISRLVFAVGVPVLLAGGLVAQNNAPRSGPVCPVMKSVVRSPDKAQKSAYRGRLYYFCCAGCKPTFDKDPQKYVGEGRS
jgi:YHS domain-containing protein